MNIYRGETHQRRNERQEFGKTIGWRNRSEWRISIRWRNSSERQKFGKFGKVLLTFPAMLSCASWLLLRVGWRGVEGGRIAASRPYSRKSPSDNVDPTDWAWAPKPANLCVARCGVEASKVASRPCSVKSKIRVGPLS